VLVEGDGEGAIGSGVGVESMVGGDEPGLVDGFMLYFPQIALHLSRP